MNDFYKKVGQNIEKYRKMKGLSAEELGNRVGLTKKTIRRYETGEIRIINDKKGMVDHTSIKPAKKSKSMSIHHGFRITSLSSCLYRRRKN